MKSLSSSANSLGSIKGAISTIARMIRHPSYKLNDPNSLKKLEELQTTIKNVTTPTCKFLSIQNNGVLTVTDTIPETETTFLVCILATKESIMFIQI